MNGTHLLIVLYLIVFKSSIAFSQNNQLVNELDRDLSIKNILVLPLVDNVSGIYSTPLTEFLNESVEKDRQWSRVPADGQKATPEELDDSPALVLRLMQSTQSDSVLAGRISKGPGGLGIRLILFTGNSGLPFASETLTEYSGFDLRDVRVQLEQSFQKLKNKLPYKGQILSRRGQLVTMNLGSSSGISEKSEVTAIQLIKVVRHPKFRFITSVDRVLMGRIEVTKVEPHLSFGMIISEREENAIQVGTKLLGTEFKEYPRPAVDDDNQVLSGITDRPDQNVAFGNSPTEWVPAQTPTVGKVGILFGLSNYQISNSLSVGSVSDTAAVAPSIHLLGELWLNPNWFMNFNLQQYILRLDNNHPSGSTPEKLNVSTQKMSLLVGYNFLMTSDFFGPKIQAMGGFTKMSSFVDQSTPAAFNSVSYSGIALGVAGMIPLKDGEKLLPYSLGGRLLYHYNPTLSESPTTSGSSSTSQISSFSALADYRHSERINFHLELNFDLYSTGFSGLGTRAQPASSVSHTLTTLAAGVEFLF